MQKHFLLLLTLILMTACSKEPQKGGITFPEDQSLQFELQSPATTVNIRFTASQIWIAEKNETDVQWYSIDPMQGREGEQSITVKVEENTGENERTASFKLICQDDEKTFTIRQLSPEMSESDFVNIPDEAFKGYLITNFDSDSDGKISKEEAAAIKTIECKDHQIKSLQGIKHMVNLEKLDCCYNQIEGELLLEDMPKLKEVYCDHNLYTKLSLKGCGALEKLKANDNTYEEEGTYTIVFTLKEIDLTGCSSLKELDLTDNNLTALDVNDSPELLDLNCRYNQISSLKFDNCTKLQRFSCRTNKLDRQKLDLSRCADLEYLECYESGVNEIDITGCSRLKEIYAYYNTELKALDVTPCRELTKLDLLGCQIVNIDLSNNPELTYLDISLNMSLESIDLSSNTRLQEIRLGYNKIPSLDVSMCSDLEILSAEGNQITQVNIAGCEKLKNVNLSENRIPEIDLSRNPALEMISLKENTLTSVDANDCPKLLILNVGFNQLTELHCDKCKEITLLEADSNLLTSLDLTPNVNLQEAYLKQNRLEHLDIHGLQYLFTCEAFENQLQRLDLKGCIALSELYIHKNPIDYLSTYECTVLRQLDCRETQLESLDLSNNHTMAFLFATENPNLHTVYISEKADYSTLSVDEGVEVYLRKADDFDDVDGEGWGDEDIDPWK